jgi:hypothetical protein
MTSSQSIKVGDEVRVFYSDGRERRNRPADGYPGEVVKVGRTLVTIRWHGGEDAFRLDTGRLNDRYGNTAYFLTPAQAEADRRQDAALALLKEAGFEVRLGRRPDGELIERLAVTVLDWTAEQTGRTS